MKPYNGLTRRNFLKYSTGTLACISFGPLIYGCGGGEGSNRVAGYPIDSNVYTTLQKTVQPGRDFAGIAPEDLQNISEYDSKMYGVWSDGGPLASVRRLDIMAVGYALPPANTPFRLLRFFAITDIHTTDKESPSQLI
ncbi:MAG: TIGR03768 family metallophosphoesterase, partial [Deltaproteobacteria bacterium]|nr:TIGR03768 family metallophosphoesterase [Deltaproteobacteria bacterium]